MRILFVAMPNSIHTARWLQQLAGTGWDLHLFPVYEADPLPELREAIVYQQSSLRSKDLHPSVRIRGLWPFRRGMGLMSRVLRPVAPAWFERSFWLARVIDRLRPDIVHSLEFQHAAYLTLDARKRLTRRMPPWIASIWGSDIYLFGRLAAHEPRVREVLATCDFYGCECRRDLELARRYGFRGECLPVVPAAGGFDLAQVRALRTPGPTSARRIILLKGYQGLFGRALVGLRAIVKCADLLRDYRIVLTSAPEDVCVAAELAAQDTGLTIECAERTSYEEVLRRLGRARISIGLSISDGIPTTLLESLLMGCFPIQSETACSAEWVRPGETGLLVHPDEPDEVAGALRRALTDDALVDRAAEANMAVAESRASQEAVRTQVLQAYEKIAAAMRR